MIFGLILAAGKGSRMRSETPKPLFNVKGKMLLARAIELVRMKCDEFAIVLGHHKEEIKGIFGSEYNYVEQTEQLGTGHAVRSAIPIIETYHPDTVLLTVVDQPLLSAATVSSVLDIRTQSNAAIAFATVTPPNFQDDFSGFMHYSRVIRNEDGKVLRVVEYKNCNEEEKKVMEVSISCLAFDAKWLSSSVVNLKQHEKTGEYHLMDLIEQALLEQKEVVAYVAPNPLEGIGVNTPEELVVAEKHIK